MKIFDYKFFKAVDGSKLTVTDEITKIFAGNDFGNRRGVVGCALSHYRLWNQLLADEENDFYFLPFHPFDFLRAASVLPCDQLFFSFRY